MLGEFILKGGCDLRDDLIIRQDDVGGGSLAGEYLAASGAPAVCAAVEFAMTDGAVEQTGQGKARAEALVGLTAAIQLRDDCAVDGFIPEWYVFSHPAFPVGLRLRDGAVFGFAGFVVGVVCFVECDAPGIVGIGEQITDGGGVPFDTAMRGTDARTTGAVCDFVHG